MPGVTVGDGTTIGANSLVTKDLPAHCLAAGSPAKVIRGPEGYPAVPDSDTKDRMLRAILAEFRGYLTDEGFDVIVQSTQSGFRWEVRLRRRPRGTLVYVGTDRAGQGGPAPGEALLSLAPVEDSAARRAASQGAMVVDLVRRRRWGFTDVGEETVLFLSRYGLRFGRED